MKPINIPEIKKTVQLRQKGFTHMEITEKLGISQKTVSNHLKRAKQLGLWNNETGEKF